LSISSHEGDADIRRFCSGLLEETQTRSGACNIKEPKLSRGDPQTISSIPKGKRTMTRLRLNRQQSALGPKFSLTGGFPCPKEKQRRIRVISAMSIKEK
jgi:hypothetical protein